MGLVLTIKKMTLSEGKKRISGTFSLLLLEDFRNGCFILLLKLQLFVLKRDPVRGISCNFSVKKILSQKIPIALENTVFYSI